MQTDCVPHAPRLSFNDALEGLRASVAGCVEDLPQGVCRRCRSLSHAPGGGGRERVCHELWHILPQAMLLLEYGIHNMCKRTGEFHSNMLYVFLCDKCLFNLLF